MYPYETNGQHLARYLLDHHLSGRESHWRGLGDALLASNRSREWVEALQEMVSLQLARRLIAAGSALTERFGVDAAEAEIKQMVVDTMIVHYTAAGDIYERLAPAVRSANETIGDSLRRTATGFAKREMPYCYLCGVEVDFSASDHRAFTLDHVWPRAYGGNSDIENVLGACASCNVAKASEPSWAMFPIQSFVAGFEVQDLVGMQKTMRFAVHARAANLLARVENLSLRDAYLRLGRPGLPAVISGVTSVDLFNLEFSEW